MKNVRHMTGALVLALLVGWQSPASANGFDISLAYFVDPVGGETDLDGFESIATDLGLTLQPRFSGPASTVGSLGFDVGYNHITTGLTNTSDAWSRAIETPITELTVSQIHVRKGLPFSLELGCAVSRIHDSKLWGVAFEIKNAFVEGYKYVPDIGTRAHISTVIGSRDLRMLAVGLDAIISKSFGLFGLFKLTPYVGYSPTFVYATSHVVGRFYGTETEPAAATISDRYIVQHRMLFGGAISFSALELAFEMARNAQVSTMGLRAGVRF